jgi:hypothetical protein
VPGLGGTLPGFGTPQGLVGRLGALNAPGNLVHGLGVAFPQHAHRRRSAARR